jgi:8-oxo-dGTP diphosphatase
VTGDTGHLRMVHVVYHRQDERIERIGFLFEATQWTGELVNREPAAPLAAVLAAGPR